MIKVEAEGRFSEIQASAKVGESTILHDGSQVEDIRILRSWRRKTGSTAHMIESFFHAFHGIWIGLKEERNLRIHFMAAVVVAGMGTWLKLDAPSWTALVLASGLVLVTEFLNTALEHLVDLSSEGRYHKSARYAKDTAAAAVLCASIAAAVVGCVVFLPHLKP